ncbi:MAG: family 43 glycosylhydrolase [Chitinophagaceae bacterium]|nr:family 43 glycosylhydrolase [Chitinophagaceae bacterium]
MLSTCLQVHGQGLPAPKPLFRDTIYDGAADPVIVWNKQKKKWYMYYTNRRANVAGLDGVTWVHGTRIGIAESKDGANWKYLDTADIQYRPVSDYTHWAPEVIEHMGTYHMYLTYVPGVFKDWRHPRDIVHLTSSDMLHWKFESKLSLSSDRVIDACVAPLPDGGWRMWYNNELDKKSIYYADSKDLFTWSDKGKAVGDRGGEGPKVFSWKGFYWMVVDNWAGLGVYRSHPDVVVAGDRAYLFYFVHPGRLTKDDGFEKRRSLIQVAELTFENGNLTCDRNKTTYIKLKKKK